MEHDRVAAGSITGLAHSADGSVSVEVGVGGGLRSVRISRDALRNGGAHLARTVLEAAEAATARANQRAHHAFGPAAANALTALGIPEPESSFEDEDRSQDSILRRPR